METKVLLEARAIQKHLRRSARKVRLVADSVRGMNVQKGFKSTSSYKKVHPMMSQK